MRISDIFRFCGILALPFLLSSCGVALERWEDNNSFMVAANPLCEEAPGYTMGAGGTCKAVTPSDKNQQTQATNDKNKQPQETKQYLGEIVNESEYFCGKFINGLVLASNGANTGLDGATTVFSALATAFSPIATVHALTAGSSITSGWKTAIDSDIYAKATVANYAQAIQSTYYSDMKAYLDALTNANEASLVISIGVAKIRSIHKECSLASAQAAISATLQPGTGTPTTATAQTVTVTDATSGDTYSLTGTGSSLKSPLSISYTFAAGDTAVGIANKLVSQIAAAADFQAAGVTATLQSADSPALVLHSPSSITWTVAGKLNLGGGKSGTTTTTTTPSPSSPATAVQTVTVAEATSGDTYSLKGTSKSLKSPLSVSYTYTTGDTAAGIANKLVSKIVAAADFKAAGVTATLQSAESTAFMLHSPSGITWAATGKLNLGPSGPETTTTTTTTTKTPGDVTTQSAIPGHAINR